MTGGTLDKEYNKLNGELVFSESYVSEMLQQARCDAPLVLERLMLKDSQTMTEADRALILQRCLTAPENRLIITHGTDTMTVTGQRLGPQITQKTVVLVGAMIPYKFGGSDALFNLASAIIAAQLLPSGVYITMNGLIFPWDNVQKNRTVGRFEKLDHRS